MTPTNNPGPRYNRGVLGVLGGQPNNSILGAVYGAWQHHKQNQQDQQMRDGMEMTPGDEPAAMPQPAPDLPESGGGSDGGGSSGLADLATDAFAGGKMVTSPTVALIAEHGPEAVVPMGHSDKVSGAMLTDQPIAAPHTSGGTARARFSHPGRAGSSARYKPISADLPLRPNSAIR